MNHFAIGCFGWVKPSSPFSDLKHWGQNISPENSRFERHCLQSLLQVQATTGEGITLTHTQQTPLKAASNITYFYFIIKEKEHI